ncbi:MAG: hypothetical protein ACXVEF_38785 [Polyangiales bacterium]
MRSPAMKCLFVFALVLAPACLVSGCKDRPLECQRLRQCCERAQAIGDPEEVRMACTRKEDDDAVICRRRLEDVQRAVPQVATEEACRAP